MTANWWSRESEPIGITALMPFIVLPLAGIGDIGTAATPYTNPLVFFFMGEFLFPAAVGRWGLYRRMAHAARTGHRHRVTPVRARLHGRLRVSLRVDQQHRECGRAPAQRGVKRGAPPDSVAALESECDEVVCLEVPPDLGAIGSFYTDFRQVSDEEVIDCLTRARGTAAGIGSETDPA